MQYRREIDGLRAIAVVPVILFHAGFSVFSGGYVGVDIFFVISGYLITSIIFEEVRNDSFRISNFYERRIRRILPALFVVIVACFPLAWLWMTPFQLKEFSQSVVAVVTFTANIEFWKESGYFAPATELSPLLHTWSLAVEEQYYLFFPILISLLWKYSKSLIIPALTVIFLISLGLSQWSSEHYPTANFYLIHTRLWELMLGSLLALLPKPAPDPHRRKDASASIPHELLGISGILLILYSIFFFNEKTPFPSLYALVPTVGTALLIRYATAASVIGKLLSLKPLVGIGLISYSAYLWHQPLFAFARIRSLFDPHWTLMLSLSVLSLTLAFLSWKYIETPFRNRNRINRRQLFRHTKAFSLALICIGITGSLTKGFPERVTPAGVTLGSLDKRIKNNHGLGKDCSGQFTLSPKCRTDEAPEILVWGDSYAMHLVDGIMQSNPKAKIVQQTVSGCGPILSAAPLSSPSRMQWASECMDFNNQVADWIKANESLQYAVLASPFGQYFGNTQLLLADGNITAGTPELLRKNLISTLEFLIRKGIKPVIFAPTPSNGENIGQCLVRSILFSRDPAAICNFNLDELSPSTERVFKFLDELPPRYKVIRIDKAMCPDGICRGTMDGKFIFADAGHLSREGSAHIGKIMDFYTLITSD